MWLRYVNTFFVFSCQLPNKKIKVILWTTELFSLITWSFVLNHFTTHSKLKTLNSQSNSFCVVSFRVFSDSLKFIYYIQLSIHIVLYWLSYIDMILLIKKGVPPKSEWMLYIIWSMHHNWPEHHSRVINEDYNLKCEHPGLKYLYLLVQYKKYKIGSISKTARVQTLVQKVSIN